jgi:hypothetical protein
MHMCRFVAVHAEERKTIGTYNRERGHCDNYTAFLCKAGAKKRVRLAWRTRKEKESCYWVLRPVAGGA